MTTKTVEQVAKTMPDHLVQEQIERLKMIYIDLSSRLRGRRLTAQPAAPGAPIRRLTGRWATL